MTPRSKAMVPPLVPVMTAVITGIMAANVPVTDTGFYCLVPLTLLALLFFLGTPSDRRLVLVLCIAAGGWGGLHMHRILHPPPGAAHISHYHTDKKLVISGTVTSFAREYPHKRRVEMTCHEVVTDGAAVAVRGKVLLNMYGKSKVYPGYGDRVRFRARVRPPRNFANPGGFDYETFLRRQGISGSVNVGARDIELLPLEDPGIWLGLVRFLETKRNRCYQFIRRVLGPGRAAEVLGALVTGKKDGLSPDTRDLWARAGGSHILAISGLHLSILALVFFGVFYRFLALFPGLAIPGHAKKAAGFLSLFPLLAYTIFSGMSPSTLRAFTMTAIFMVSFLSERENDPINTLSMAGILILLADPGALFSISFQLSFTAVLFLILGFGLARRIQWVKGLGKVPAYICSACMVTLLAGFGTLPLILYYFNLVSLVQVPANLILVPMMGFACLPLGLGALACMDLLPGPAGILVRTAGFLVDLCTGFITHLTDLPFAWSRIPGVSQADVMLLYALAAVLFLFFKFGRTPWTLSTGLAWACAVLLWWAPFMGKPVPPARDLAVTILDVGQGNAAHIRTIEGKHLLVDGGGFGSGTTFDTGRYILAPYLWRQGITTLEAVILTHPDADHMNGLVFILENFNVMRLVKNRDASKHKTYQRLMAACRERNIPVFNPGCESNALAWDRTRIRFFHCRSVQPGRSSNENSLVFKLVMDEFSMLFTGDIMARREQAFDVLGPGELNAGLMLAPHHGSATSSSKFFLDKVQPESVIISCGFKNRYGFPHPAVLERYKRRGTKIFRTDIHGAVRITTNGYGYLLTTQRGG